VREKSQPFVMCDERVYIGKALAQIGWRGGQNMERHQLDRRGFLTLAPAVAGTHLATSSAAMGSDKPEIAAGTVSYSTRLPVLQKYDAVVCGGGPAGTAAALAACRVGLKVLVVEGQGQLGGNGTSGHVSHWLGGRTSDCRQWAVGGIFRAMTEEAAAKGFALIPVPDAKKKYQPHGWYKGQLVAGIPFDPFAMARYLDAKLLEAGVDILLSTHAADVHVDGTRITHVVIYNKSGLAAVPTQVVIDATGDADIAARSGCGFVKGRDEDGLMTPASLTFHVDNVDQDALDQYIHQHNSPRFRQKIREVREAGSWPFPYEIFISVQLQEKGTMMINTTRLVGVDGTDGRSCSEGMIRGREEIQQLVALMRGHFPGFAEARLKTVAPALGVRETRRIQGAFTMTVEDLRAGRGFEDTIGFSAYGWDLPNPKRPSDNPSHGKKPALTPIPYRTMLPTSIENLICPGRAISVERPLLGPLRVMAPCMAMGEAAGQAAAQAVRHGVAFRDVDIARLRAELKENGAVV